MKRKDNRLPSRTNKKYGDCTTASPLGNAVAAFLYRRAQISPFLPSSFPPDIYTRKNGGEIRRLDLYRIVLKYDAFCGIIDTTKTMEEGNVRYRRR